MPPVPLLFQVRRTAARTEVARMILEGRPLRIVLGAVVGDEKYFEGDWLGVNVDTLDVTEIADFE